MPETTDPLKERSETKDVQLSIIVPVFNESNALKPLFSMLSKQVEVSFELLIADGGSSDTTADGARRLARQYTFTTRVVTTKKGRGRQMNRAAGVAKGRTLLFLHADSYFASNLALASGIKELENEASAKSTQNIAGRFSLKFRHESGYRPSERTALGYRYYENKARLPLVECVNGDQGFLVPQPFWKKTGPFDETLPFLEDRGFAKCVEKNGRWLLLSPEIFTSSRRFVKEGLYERQTLNALIMNFYSSGWPEFITGLPDIYKHQDKTGKMEMRPFFRRIRSMISELTVREQFDFWYKTGSYICQNAWQIPFYMDIKREFVKDGKGRPFLRLHELVTRRLISNPVGRFTTTTLVWAWFHFHCFRRKPPAG